MAPSTSGTRRRPVVDTARVEAAVQELLFAIGENPLREGLVDTPARVARTWREFIEHDPGTLDTTFTSSHVDQVVCVSGMRVWSYCEHHLVPFWCDITAAYLPRDTLLGLSKIGRLARSHAHRLQLQERLAEGIADDLERLTGSPDVAVIATGQHLCMVMRGVQMPATMSTSIVRGAFRAEGPARAELFSLIAAASAASTR